VTVRNVERRTVAGLHTTIWPGTGQAVVGLPGLSSTAAVWAPVAESLPDANFVGPDLRGRGGSQHLAGTAGLRTHARDVAALLDELDLQGVVVVGHSMGAYLAPVVAQEAPKRVARLVLIDGGIPPAFPWVMRPAVVRMMFRRQLSSANHDWPDVESFARKGKFDRMVASQPELRPVLLEMLRGELTGPDDKLRPRIDVDHAVADAADVFFGPDLGAALDALTVPAAVFLAENQKWEGQKPFISDRAVAPWLERQPLLSVRRLPGNHVTVLFAPEIREAIAA